jgi:hypothetical protein
MGVFFFVMPLDIAKLSCRFKMVYSNLALESYSPSI